MQYATIPGLAKPVSRVVLGSMALHPGEQDTSDAILDAYLAGGGTLVDTAIVYRGGGSERAIGNWLRRRQNRDSVMILAKGAHTGSDGTGRVTAEEIAFDLGRSLERLGTDYVDLYLLHRDNPSRPVGPIVEALSYHQRLGRIRAYGGSNWTHERIQEANDYAAAHGLQPFVASSPNLSLAVPNEPMWADTVSVSGDAAALDWYRRTQLPLLSWSSQGGGFFSGRFSPDVVEDKNVARVYYSAANWERYARVQRLAAELGRTTIEIALAWVLNQTGLNVFALIGPHNVEELEGSLAAAELTLTPAQVAWLNLERDTP